MEFRERVWFQRPCRGAFVFGVGSGGSRSRTRFTTEEAEGTRGGRWPGEQANFRGSLRDNCKQPVCTTFNHPPPNPSSARRLAKCRATRYRRGTL